MRPALGYLIASVGAACGMLLGRYKRASEAVDPIVMGLYSLPRVHQTTRLGPAGHAFGI